MVAHLTIDYILKRGIPKKPSDAPFNWLISLIIVLSFGFIGVSWWMPDYDKLRIVFLLCMGTLISLLVYFSVTEIIYIKRFRDAIGYYQVPLELWERGDFMPVDERFYSVLKCFNQHNSNGTCFLCKPRRGQSTVNG